MENSREKLITRKRNIITIQKKIEIIECVEKGESMKNLAKRYNIGRSTISDIMKQKTKIQKLAEDVKENLTRKKMTKRVQYPFLESKVLEWYESSRQQGIFVTGPMISQKAQELHTELGSEGNFCASKGWLERFKTRNGIKLCGLREVKSNTKCDGNAVDSFTKHLQCLIQYYNLLPEQIYNADETDLFWKMMPKPSAANEIDASVRAYRERMTVMCCSNATGNHKLPLVCIGRRSRGVISNDQNNLIQYYPQETAWMDHNIFFDWYHNHFVHNVRKHLKSCGLPEVALLIIDQHPSHPRFEYLKTNDNSFIVLYLTPEVKTLLQPMQQGVIQDLKSFYRYSLLSDVVNRNLLFADFEKHLNLNDSLKILGKAWHSVSPLRIKQSFSKILSQQDYLDIIQECDIDVPTLESFSKLTKMIPECSLYNYTIHRVTNWLFCDSENTNCDSNDAIEMDLSYQNTEETLSIEFPTDENCIIFEEIESIENNLVHDKSDELTGNVDCIQEEFIDDDLEMIAENDFFEHNCDVSSEEALSAIETVLKFMKNDPQSGCRDLEFLRELKDKLYNRINEI